MRKAFLQLHVAVVLAGFTGILGRLINLREDWLVWYRMLFASITLWLIFIIAKKSFKVSLKQAALLFGVGAIVALHWVTFYGSIKYANVSIALVCFSALGFFTAILEPIVFRKKFSLQEILLGLMVIAGIYIIFHFDPRYKTGIIIGIISALLASLFPIFNRKMVQNIKPEIVTLYEMTGGFCTLTLVLPLYARLAPAGPSVPTSGDVGWLLILAWFCTVLAFQLSMNALKKISAFTVNLTYNLEPLYGILLAFVVFHENEQLGKYFYLGLGIIVLAVLLQTLRIYRAHRLKSL